MLFSSAYFFTRKFFSDQSTSYTGSSKISSGICCFWRQSGCVAEFTLESYTLPKTDLGHLVLLCKRTRVT